jgi:hypothetical protein
MMVELKSSSKQNKIGQLTIKNYKFEKIENCKYLVVFNEDDNHQIDLQEKLKVRLRNAITEKTLTYASKT